MPIVTVEVVAGANDPVVQDVAQSLADAIGHALESPPGQTWVRVRSIARDHYAENDTLLDAARLPVFVTILKMRTPELAKLEGEVTRSPVRLPRLSVVRPRACTSSTRPLRRCALRSAVSSFNDHAANSLLNPDAWPAALARHPLGAG
jgi:phenylpyruvate tautomerase PptA (4-oxalocrotonate tautomerase family)